MKHTAGLLLAIAIAIQGTLASMEWEVKGLNAVSNADTTVLQTVGGTSGARFLYTKTKDPMPLVDVYLRNEESGKDYLLQSKFDIVNQECSCYWLDAKDLTSSSKFPTTANIPSSLQYRIIFKNDKYASGSGYLGIVRGDNTDGLEKPTKPLTDPTVAGTDVTPPAGGNADGQKPEDGNADGEKPEDGNADGQKPEDGNADGQASGSPSTGDPAQAPANNTTEPPVDPASQSYGGEVAAAPATGGYGSAPANGGYGTAPVDGGYGTQPAGAYGAPSSSYDSSMAGSDGMDGSAGTALDGTEDTSSVGLDDNVNYDDAGQSTVAASDATNQHVSLTQTCGIAIALLWTLC